MNRKPGVSTIKITVVPSAETIDFDAWAKQWAHECIRLARQRTREHGASSDE